MRRTLIIAHFFSALCVILFSSTATAANIPNDPCPGKLGHTVMSDDKDAIIACLQTSKTDPTLIWKATTAPTSSKGAECNDIGYVHTGIPKVRFLYNADPTKTLADIITVKTYTGVSGAVQFNADYPALARVWMMTTGFRQTVGTCKSPYTLMACSSEVDTTVYSLGTQQWVNNSCVLKDIATIRCCKY